MGFNASRVRHEIAISKLSNESKSDINMIINSANLVVSDKRARLIGGVYIEFTSTENLQMECYLKTTYNDTIHYFTVTSIATDNEHLNITAREVGYYASKFDFHADFDLRNIIGLPLQIVDDKDEIRSVIEQSCLY